MASTSTKPDPSADPPRVHHPWRDAWTIVWTLAWLAIHAALWLVIVCAIVLGWGIVLGSVLVRAL